MHFFGVAGSNIDINVLNRSSVFDEMLKGHAPELTTMLTVTTMVVDII